VLLISGLIEILLFGGFFCTTKPQFFPAIHSFLICVLHTKIKVFEHFMIILKNVDNLSR
jgi:hypothetical protein